MSRTHHKLSLDQLDAVLRADLPLPAPGATEVPCDEALGRVLAVTLRAPFNLPPTAVSPVDGFAITAEVTNKRQRIAGTSTPGDDIPAPPPPGEVIAVMTGGPLPDGCTGIIPREQADEAEGGVMLRDAVAVPPTPPGARMAKGDVIATEGTRLRPSHLARMADFGMWRVPVFGRPSVNLLAVGTELAHDAPGHHDGNSPHLAALVRLAGGTPMTRPPAADDIGAIRDALDACHGDLIITTGGTAEGDFDLTAKAASEAGFTWVIDGLALRPGRSVRVALKEEQVLVSLPGSPGAVGPLFTVLVKPILARLAGDAAKTEWWQGRLATPYTRIRPLPVLSHAEVALVDGAVRVTPVRGDGNGLVLLPEGETPLGADTPLPVLPTHDPPVLADP